MRYEIESEGFIVTAQPSFQGVQDGRGGVSYYIFAYEIVITNKSEQAAQLLSRHWIIRDGLGREENVRGEGVIGQRPLINPGESFSYMSGCPLSTPTGNMRGTYKMTGLDGRKFDIKIPLFFLRPDSLAAQRQPTDATV